MLEMKIGEIESNKEAEEIGIGIWKFVLAREGDSIVFYAGTAPCDAESTTEYVSVAERFRIKKADILGGGLMMYEGAVLQFSDGSEDFGPVPSAAILALKKQLTAEMGLRHEIAEVVVAMDNTSNLVKRYADRVKFWKELGYGFN